MTTKEAAERFNLSERTIRRLANEGKIIGACKVEGSYEIPDDTPIIITEKMARAFLLKVLKLRNNPNLIVSTQELSSEVMSRVWYQYMLRQELVGDCEYTSEPRKLLLRMQLTEKGMEQVIGKKTFGILEKLRLEPTINLNFSQFHINA